MEELRFTNLGPNFCLSFFSQPTHFGHAVRETKLHTINLIVEMQCRNFYKHINSIDSGTKSVFIFLIYLLL